MIKRSTAKDLKKQIEFLYDTADVTVSYSYWFNKLLALLGPIPLIPGILSEVSPQRAL